MPCECNVHAGQLPSGPWQQRKKPEHGAPGKYGRGAMLAGKLGAPDVRVCDSDRGQQQPSRTDRTRLQNFIEPLSVGEGHQGDASEGREQPQHL